MEQIRGGLVFKAQRSLYHSTQGSRKIKKKKRRGALVAPDGGAADAPPLAEEVVLCLAPRLGLRLDELEDVEAVLPLFTQRLVTNENYR